MRKKEMKAKKEREKESLWVMKASNKAQQRMQWETKKISSINGPQIDLNATYGRSFVFFLPSQLDTPKVLTANL